MQKLASISIMLALPGCAWRAAVDHAETAAAAQEWQRAYDAYRFANELKPGKADAPLAEARNHAIAAELEAAAAAVAGKDYTKAYDHIDEAGRLAPAAPEPRVVEAQAAARAALLADLPTRIAEDQDLAAAYAFVALAKGLEPHSPEVEDAAAALRGRVEAATRSKLDDGKFAEARETARLMAELEPEQRTRGAALEQSVTAAWVADLTDDAKRAERARPGLAAVYWARAHEVGGDPAHAEAAKVALEAAAATAPMDVFVDTQGTGGRHWRLRKAVRATLDGLPSVDAGTTSRWDLMATVVAADERCTETSVKKPLEKEYKSGTRQVPNPAYADVSKVLADAEAEQRAAEGEATKLRSAHDQAANGLRTTTTERERAQKDHDEDVATLEATKVQITATADRVAAAEKELAALGEAGNATTATQLKQQLSLVRGFHEEWKRKETQDQAAVNGSKAVLDKIDAALATAKPREEERATALKAGETRLAEAKARVAELTTKRNSTPKTNTEDVMATAKYAETTWTLTCEGPATVRYGAGFATERSKSQKVAARTETTDLERPGHEAAGIAADPKAFPRPKADLVAEVDATSAKAVSDELGAFVAEYFARELEGSFAATADPDAATDTLVSLAAGAPERVDAAARARIVEHLAKHYGLVDPTPLKVPAPAAPPPETAVGATPAPTEPPSEG